MPSKIDEDLVDDIPPSISDPYAILELSTDASDEDIKKAYRKAALKHHPDKASPDEKGAAHTKFQSIAFAYGILSDPRRRRRYDSTGRTEDVLDLEDDDFDWRDFYRELYENTVTEASVMNFSKEYKGGTEEREALLAAFTKYKGNMRRVYEDVMLSNPLDDEDRFRAILDSAIEKGEVEAFDAYLKESERSKKSRMDKARREADEAEEHKAALEKKKEKKMAKAKKGDTGEDSLVAMIQQRQKARASNFLEHLEEKYAQPAKKGKKRGAADEPPEELFAKNDKKLKTAKAKSKA